MQVPKNFSVNLEDLIEIIEDSMSGQTYAILKRPAEASVIVKAHTKPRFSEDVVREILGALIRKYENFPDETRIFAQAFSEESVHKHDIISERMATLEELMSEINSE
jgi:MptA/FolE2 family GTP cyclohydrolase